MRIVQISDTHISCDHPSRVTDFERCVDAINALDRRPEVVVHTGDVAHNGLREEYEIARELLEKLAAPYFVLPGNRDNRQELTRIFADGRHIRSGMDFVQYSVEHLEVRLVILDTVSPKSNKGCLCPARLAHFERMLSENGRRPTALFLHHPPFEISAIPDPRQFEVWAEAEALAARLGRQPDICGVFCGHVHRSVDGAIGSVKASTLSCVAVDLRKGHEAAQHGPIFNVFTIP